MGHALHESPYLQHWRALGLKIRCALEPDEPRLIEHYLAEGRYLARFTATPSRLIAKSSFNLLLDTARDTALPWHWRSLCLDQTWRPLRDLQAQVCCQHQRQIWQRLAHELATCTLEPSISLFELLEGRCDE